MPYESKAQQGWFHAHRDQLEREGVDVAEWDRASKGKKLPERKSDPKHRARLALNRMARKNK